MQIKCPNCNSEEVSFVQNNKKNFSVKKAIVDGAIVGPAGALAGLAGKSGKNQFLCKSCSTL